MTGNTRFDRGLAKARKRQTPPPAPTATQLAMAVAEHTTKKPGHRAMCSLAMLGHLTHTRRHHRHLAAAAKFRDLSATMHTLGTIAARPTIKRRINR